MPVTCTVAPAGSAADMARAILSPYTGPSCGPVGGVNTRPNTVRPSAPTNLWSWVDAYETTRRSGAIAAAANAVDTAGSSGAMPSGNRITGTTG